MALPLIYKSTINIPNSEKVRLKKVFNPVFNEISRNPQVSNKKQEENKISFEFKALFNVKYPVEINISKKNILRISFEVKLIKLVQISIALVVFTAFFSSFGFSGFLWFSAFLTLGFYGLNVLFIENAIQKLIKSTTIYKSLNPITEAHLSNEQLKWMKDVNKCPACGEDLQSYDQNCPDCGLKLPRKATPKPFDVSKYSNKRIKYTYKPKKEKNDT